MARREHVDAGALSGALRRLEQTGTGHDVEGALHEVCVAAADLLGVSGSGILLIDEGRVQRSTVASDDLGKLLEVHQETVGEGPCVDAMMNDEVTWTPDVAADARWPRLAKIMRGTALRAICGAPIHVGGQTIGSLNVYRTDVYEWDDSDVAASQSFAAIAGRLLSMALIASSQERVVQQLQHALENRVAIERAVGVLMGRHRLKAVDAFERLRQRARAEQRKVVDVASEVLAGISPEL